MFKILQVGFSSISIKNFQMYKLDLDKAEEPEIKLPTAIENQGNSRKIYASLTTLKPTTSSGRFLKKWEY